jgi:hypothetical protein
VVVFVFCLCRKKNYEEKKIDKKNSNIDEKSKVNFIPEVSSFFFEQFIFATKTEFT